MSADVGSIIGYLRLDRSDWDNELRAAGVKADELARHNPDIRIRTNAPTAITQLAAVAAATKRLQDAQGAEAVAESRLNALRAKGITEGPRLAAAENAVEKARRAQALATIQLADANDKNTRAMEKAAADAEKLGQDADKAGNQVKFSLVGALATVAPAAVPIAAVAGGALLGLIPVIATLRLGITGISKDLKDGALAGTQYAGDIQLIRRETQSLQQTAAEGILSGLDRGLAASHGLLGTVNSDIGMMSNQLGNIIAGGAPALLRILNDLNPLFVTFGDVLTRGADELSRWATNSTGVTSFVGYVQREMPIVLRTVGDLVVLFGHVVQAAAPVGDTVLHVLDGITRALDAVPVSVLTELGYAFVALYPVVKLVGIIKAISAGMTELGLAATSTKAAVLGLAAAPLVFYALGKSISNATEASNAFAQSLNHSQGQSDSMMQALLQSKGVIDAGVKSTVQAALAQDNLTAKAARAGITYQQLTTAVTGNKQSFVELLNQWKASGKPSGDTLAALILLYGQFHKNKAAAALYAAQQHQTTDTVLEASKAFAAFRTALKGAETAVLALGQTELAQATTEDAYKEGLLGLTKTLHSNKNELNTNTAAGLANRDALLQLLGQAQAVAQAQAKNHVAIPKVTTDLMANVKQLEATAIGAGLSKTAVQDLVAQMHLTPKDIRTTFKTNAGVVVGEVSTIYQRMKDLTSVNWVLNVSQVMHGGVANVGGGIKAKAAGGYITGPGSSTSDSIPAALSNGEFVVNAAATARNRGLLEALNSGPAVPSLPSVAPAAAAARAGDGATLALTPLLNEVRALRAQVSGLAGDIGTVQAQVGAGLYERAGRATAAQLVRAGRKG